MSDPTYRLSLYVTGASTRSARALVNVRAICDRHLGSQYELQVIDIAEQPSLARHQQLVAVPTLIRHLPLPERRFIGDMSHTEHLVRGLELDPALATDGATG